MSQRSQSGWGCVANVASRSAVISGLVVFYFEIGDGVRENAIFSLQI